MKLEPFMVTPDTYPLSLNVVGEKITVLASNALTHGYEIFLQQGDEGTGPPPHSHDWDESFYVIKGVVDISYGDISVTATPGSFVHVPAGNLHSFRFGVGGGEMISVTCQKSKAAELFSTIDQEVPAGPPDVSKLIAIAEKFGVSFTI
jgi:mannose-6-phosphate isomerase-like protein (cupin superfamily)